MAGLIHPEDLHDAEKIYLAASLREARQIEAVLTGHGVEYVVEVEELGRTTLFGSLRHGAGFYVTATQAASCRSLLALAGFTRGLVDAPGGDPGPR
jgi:hypothetical protein